MNGVQIGLVARHGTNNINETGKDSYVKAPMKSPKQKPTNGSPENDPPS